MQGFSKMDCCHLRRHHPHLPEDVIEAILIRLPVESLIRFKCVSKSWYILIKSSRFINKHLITSQESFLAMCFVVRLSQQVDQRLLAVCPYDHHTETSSRLSNQGVNGFINLCDSQNQAAQHTLPLPNFVVPPDFRMSILNLVGHCNGIMCLAYYSIILLVNPSLKQVKMLPDSGFIPDCKLVGFGFDSITMDFKVIRVFDLKSWTLQQRTEVYNLTSNEWRKVDDFPLVVDYSSACSTFLNGVVYWCAGSELFGWRIVTFNMATELFEQMEFPQDWDKRESLGWYENVPSLFVLNQESLAFVSCCHPFSSSRFVNVWTMNKQEKEETWTKLYSIGPLPQFLKPISFYKKHKFLYKTTTGKLILYGLLNYHSSVVCDDLSQLRPYDAHCSELCLEIGECRSSLVSINT